MTKWLFCMVRAVCHLIMFILIAVETGRLTIDFIPMMYKREVARILGIGEVTKEG